MYIIPHRFLNETRGLNVSMEEGGVEEKEEISRNVANRVSMGGSSSSCCGDFIANVYPAVRVRLS